MQSFSLVPPANSGGMPVLEASVQVSRPEIWKNLLQEGASLEVICRVELLASRTLLPDSLYGESSYRWQLRFDPLTRDYLLIQDGQTLRHESLATLMGSFLDDMVLPLPSEKALEAGKEYQARMVLSLVQSNVPEWMKKTLFFWSWDVAPSQVFEQNFVYEEDTSHG